MSDFNPIKMIDDYLASGNIIEKGVIEIERMETANGSIHLYLKNDTELQNKEIKLVIMEQSHNHIWSERCSIKGNKISSPINHFTKAIPGTETILWKICIAVYNDGIVLLRRVTNGRKEHPDTPQIFDHREYYMEPALRSPVNGEEVETVPFYTVHGHLGCKTALLGERYQKQFCNRMNRVEFKDSEIWLEVSAYPFPNAEFGLAICSSDKKKSYTFSDLVMTDKKNGFDIYEAKLDLAGVPELDSDNWCVFSVYRRDRIDFTVPLSIADKKINKKFETGDSGKYYMIPESNKKIYVNDVPNIGLCLMSKFIVSHARTVESDLPIDELVQQKKLKLCGRYEAVVRIPKESILEIEFSYHVLSQGETYYLYLKNETEPAASTILPCWAVWGSDHKCTVDLSELCGQNQAGYANWLIYMIEKEKNRFSCIRLLGKTDVRSPRKEDPYLYDRTNQYLEPAMRFVTGGKTFAYTPYVSRLGNYSLEMAEESERYIYQFITEFRDLRIKSNTLYITVDCGRNDKNWTGISIQYRFGKEEDRKDYYFPGTIRRGKRGSVQISVRIDLKEIGFQASYWDIRVVFEEKGQKYFVLPKAEYKRFNKKLSKLFQDNRYLTDKNHIVFPYITMNHSIALLYRERTKYDGFVFRCKERFGYLYFRFNRKRLLTKKIFLVYEKFCIMAQDNGYFFFQYCMEHNLEEKMNRKIYYVISKKSPDYDRVKSYKGHLLSFMSVKFIGYLIASRLLIGTDTKSHMYVWENRPSFLQPRIDAKKYVFLQHGVTAFKRVDKIYTKTRENACDLFIVTSENERDIIRKSFKYDLNEIAVTGFSRWDVLEDHSENSNEILIMPTWRNWLDEVSDEEFKKSDYFRSYMQLLTSGQIFELLEKNDLILNFYIHPKFREYITNFNIDKKRIHIMYFGTEPLNELLMKCKLLVTDYSSVAWDVFYQKKPVLFYQFDYEQYMRANGSYVDMEHDLFGERSLTLEELTGHIREYIRNGFILKEKYAAVRDSSYKYIDSDNSKRICENIKRKGW